MLFTFVPVNVYCIRCRHVVRPSNPPALDRYEMKYGPVTPTGLTFGQPAETPRSAEGRTPMNDTQEISRFLETRIHHAYTIETGSDGVHAEDADDSLGVTSECLAKSVPLVVDGRICMAVIPATRQVNLEKLRHYMKAGEVR